MGVEFGGNPRASGMWRGLREGRVQRCWARRRETAILSAGQLFVMV